MVRHIHKLRRSLRCWLLAEHQRESHGAALSGLREGPQALQGHLLGWLHSSSLVGLPLGPITPQTAVLLGVTLLSKLLLKPHMSDWFRILTSAQASCSAHSNQSSAWPYSGFTDSISVTRVQRPSPSHDPSHPGQGHP